jgi:hypothetical protein
LREIRRGKKIQANAELTRPAKGNHVQTETVSEAKRSQRRRSGGVAQLRRYR